MINLTIPRAVLIGSCIIALAILFRLDDRLLFIAEANAEVAGMSHRDLRRDRDFKKAVIYILENNVGSIVENCTVSGYVDGDYLYGTSISC